MQVAVDVEQRPDFRVNERGDLLVTSALTLGELLVKPRERGEDAVRDHESTIRQIATILPFEAASAAHYAAIRADRAIKGRLRGNAWDELALLAAELAGVRVLGLPRNVA